MFEPAASCSAHRPLSKWTNQVLLIGDGFIIIIIIIIIIISLIIFALLFLSFLRKY